MDQLLTSPQACDVRDTKHEAALYERLCMLLTDELASLGVRDAARDAVLHVLAARLRAGADLESGGLRRRARRLVDACLRRAVAQLALPAMPDLLTRRAALLALDIARQWPGVWLAPPPDDFLTALRAALPIAMPPPAPLDMPPQPLHQRASRALTVPGPDRFAWLGARPAIGKRLRRMGLFVTPEEAAPPPVLRRLTALGSAASPLVVRDGLACVLESPLAAARHLALLTQLPPRELTAPMALARCRADEVSAATLAVLFPRELRIAALSDRPAVMRLIARCTTSTVSPPPSALVDECLEAGRRREGA